MTSQQGPARAQAQAEFAIPPGNVAVRVSIIDTSSRIGKIPLTFLMQPAVEHMDYMPELPSWSFLIEHPPSGHKAVFDLGMPRDRTQLAPVVADDDRFLDWDIRTPREVVDVLEQHGVAASGINSIIWSHWHWDHIGDPSRFPSSTDLIVGPGFTENFYPGYPNKVDSPVRQSDFQGRKVVEISFDEPSRATRVGDFRAHDFFGDGSFYLLDTPGHAIGHMGALARTTTSPQAETFIFMGGDLCHHSGQIRPSPYLHIPITPSPSPSDPPSMSLTAPVPHDIGRQFQAFLRLKTGSSDTALFTPAPAQCVSEEASTTTRARAQKADAQESVWFVSAHDPSLAGVVDFFPAPANAWREKGWRARTMWAFLADLEGAIRSSI